VTGRWVAPLDPDCPTVERFNESLDDPMTRASGCSDDIVESFERQHRKTCTRCQEYGAANLDVQY
jgi:hypothetical protein